VDVRVLIIDDQKANRKLAREALWDARRTYDRNEVQSSNAGELEDFALQAYCQACSLEECHLTFA
jgi:CheY-like chemotaxis protein